VRPKYSREEPQQKLINNTIENASSTKNIFADFHVVNASNSKTKVNY
jgi:hypothetical protein